MQDGTMRLRGVRSHLSPEALTLKMRLSLIFTGMILLLFLFSSLVLSLKSQVPFGTGLFFFIVFLSTLLAAGLKMISMITSPLDELGRVLDETRGDDDLPEKLGLACQDCPELQRLVTSFDG